MKIIFLPLLIVIISLSWFIPTFAENYEKELKSECIDGYIKFTYIDLQSGTLSEIEKIGFANYWFEKCFDLDYRMTSGDFMDRVDKYLEDNK